MAENNDKKKLVIRSTIAFIIWLVCLAGGFIFTGYKPMAQYGTFAMWLTVGLASYLGKRVWKFVEKLKFDSINPMGRRG